MSGRFGLSHRWSRLLREEKGGIEQVEYLLIIAFVVLPVFLAIKLLWSVLQYYYYVQALVVDMPWF